MSDLAQSVALFMTEGSSDKEYRAQLVQAESGWLVNFQNGRRGKPLRHGTKTAAALPYDQALEVYGKLVKSKKKGGYTESADGRTFQDLPDGLEHSGVRLQLLSEVDASNEDGIEKLLEDPDWFLQQKHDGERRALIKDGDNVYGTNRDGIIVPLATEVVDALLQFKTKKIIIDGEDMGSHIAVFDLLHLEDGDTKILPFSKRINLLNHMIYTTPGIEATGPLRSSTTARSAQEKRSLYNRARELGQEGLVFKHKDAPYEAGRTISQYKVKFKAEATCQVIERNATKRSASIGVLVEPMKADDKVPTLLPVGNVTLPPSVEVKPGDLIEVQYLYAYQGGSLYQPVFKCHRSDKTEPDTASLLKFKAEDVLIEEVPDGYGDTVYSAPRPRVG